MLTRRVRAAGLEPREEATAAGSRAVAPEELACAVLDIDFDDGDGVAVAIALRAGDPELPIAFYSGGATDALLEGARALGPVFTKPAETDAVIAWVTRYARI